MKNKGYTLMELIVVITLLVIVVVGGTSLFISNLRSGGRGEVVLRTSKASRTLADTIESKLRFSSLESVDEFSRDNCLAAGLTGVTGTSVIYQNLEGQREMLKLGSGTVASSSADSETGVNLSSSEVVVEGFNIQWFCVPGINDKIKIELTLRGSGVGVKDSVEEKVSREMILLNSGKK